jgi:hypothetical protein
MTIGLYASKIQAEVLAEREVLEKAYRDYPDANLYWCMVDLAKSSNYRLAIGPERGYVRGETFFSLITGAAYFSSVMRHWARCLALRHSGSFASSKVLTAAPNVIGPLFSLLACLRSVIGSRPPRKAFRARPRLGHVVHDIALPFQKGYERADTRTAGVHGPSPSFEDRDPRGAWTCIEPSCGSSRWLCTPARSLIPKASFRWTTAPRSAAGVTTSFPANPSEPHCRAWHRPRAASAACPPLPASSTAWPQRRPSRRTSLPICKCCHR